jgi:hypothetical protein
VNIARIKGATRVLGESQGFLGLPIRDEVIETSVGDTIEQMPSMVSEWEPTPQEYAAILAGAPIQIRLLGSQHPPIMVLVGDIPK